MMRTKKYIAILLTIILTVTGILQTSELSIQLRAEEINSVEKKISIYYYNEKGWDNPYLYYYNDNSSTKVEGLVWPGDKMTEVEDEEGWYSFTINGLEEAKVLFNNGHGEQIPEKNKEGFLVSKEMWYKDGAWFEEQPDDMIVHFYKPEGWASPNLYYYKTEQETGPAWPGLAMEDEFDGWYHYIIPEYTKAKVLFNDGTKQIPARLVEGFELTKEMWYKDGQWYEEDPEENNLEAEWFDEEEEYNNRVEADYDDLSILYNGNDCYNCITQNITLPVTGTYNSNITWSSNRPDIITDTGIVTRPEGESQKVMISAAITDGTHTKIKEFEVKVAKEFEEVYLKDNLEDELVALNKGELPDICTDENDIVTYLCGSYTDYKIESPEEAIQSLESVKFLLNLKNPKQEFKLTSMEADEYSVDYRLHQLYKGLRVGEHEVLLTTDLDGNTTSLQSSYYYDFEMDINPTIKEQAAEEVAKKVHPGTYETINQELMIYTEKGLPTLAWEFHLNPIEEEEESEGYTIVVDATTGDILEDIIQSKSLAKANITGKNYDGKEKTLSGTKYTTTEQKEKNIKKYALYDINRNIKIYDAKDKQQRGKLISSKTKKFSNKIAITAYQNMKKIYDYYKKNFDRKSYDRKGSPIRVIINYNHKNNGRNISAWAINAKEIRLGTGEGKYISLGIGLDVLAHEFTHAVMESKVNLKYQGITGAIEEAYCDILGNFIENDSDPRVEWLIGEDVVITTAVRSMLNPNAYGDSQYVEDRYWKTPSDISRENDYGGVHSNSTVLSHAAFLMHEKNVGSKTMLAKLWYKSIASLKKFSSSPTFEDVRFAVSLAAKNMKLSAEKVQKINEAFNEVGVKIFVYRKMGFLEERLNEENGEAILKGSIYKGIMLASNEDKTPLDNVQVNILNEKNESVGTTYTNEDGKYQIKNLPIGAYTIATTKEGYVTYTREINLQADKEQPDIYLEVNQECSLNGRLTIADNDMNAINNEALKEAKITIEKLSGYKDIKLNTISDQNGLYEFKKLLPGVYQIVIEKEGYLTATQSITMKEDQPNYYNAILEIISNDNIGNGRASGKIKDVLTGEGVKDLTLKVRYGFNNISKGDIVAQFYTDEQGDYQTGSLPAGYYTLQIEDKRELENEEDRYLGNLVNIKILGDCLIDSQNGTVTTGIASEQVRIVLSWGEEPSDLDSHLIGPTSDGTNFHISYRNKQQIEHNRLVAELDLDDTSSFGPETTTIYRPNEGTYCFYVHNYTGTTEEELKNSGAYVQVYLGSALEPAYTFNVPQENGKYWTVFEYDSHSKKISPINMVGNAPVTNN